MKTTDKRYIKWSCVAFSHRDGHPIAFTANHPPHPALPPTGKGPGGGGRLSSGYGCVGPHFQKGFYRFVGNILFLAMIVLHLLGAPAARAEEEIIVSAAASLTNAMKEVGKHFEEAAPPIKVIFNFGSSGSLLQQMLHGAPVDVFASANQRFMDKAQQAGLLLQQTRKIFARNRLVVAAPADSNIPIKGLEDLLNAGVTKIAIGNPRHVPAGQYARQALEGYGLWNGLSEKFIFAGNVRQIADYLVRKEIDFGLLYATDVVGIQGDSVKTVLELSRHDPIVYPISLLAGARNKKAAQLFITFVLSDRGQEILSRFGFQEPDFEGVKRSK